MRTEPASLHERLAAARTKTAEGDYAAALDEFVWFHEHALEVDEGFYGVRLSFALAYWVELGALYPRALEVLRETRDRAYQRLVDGAADFELFHEVEAINERLRDGANTCRLFGELSVANPELASECLDVAMRALVEHGLYELARRHLGPPAEAVARLARNVNEQMETSRECARSGFTEKSWLRLVAGTAARYAADIARIELVLAATGSPLEAAKLRAEAAGAIDDEAVRSEIERALAAGH